MKGTAVGPTTPPVAGATSLTVSTVGATNSLYPTMIPVGARFRIAGETTPMDHAVTARVQGTGTGGANETQTVAVTNATGGTLQAPVERGRDAGDRLRRGRRQRWRRRWHRWWGRSRISAVTGSLGNWTVVFQGTLANSPQPYLTADTSNLIGTDAYVAIAETVAGIAPRGAAGRRASPSRRP